MNNKIFFDKKWNTRNYQQIDYSTKNFSGYCPLEGIQEVSKLSKQYFSKQNINKIQQGIQKQIYIKSNYKYKIGNQSENELIVIMRAMYLKYSKNLDTNIKEQICELNNKVFEYSIPNILSNIEQKMGYLNSINNNNYIMERSQNMSSKGTKIPPRTKFI